AVVIGGGVSGASVAYHLTELGWTDVLLVERSELTSGSTFHSAGLVGQLRSSVSLTKMMMYGVELYRRLAEETGVDPSWHDVGSLRLASSKERIEELRRLAGWGQTFGLPLEIVSTERALELWPLFDPQGVEGAAYLPSDGYLDPTGLTMALVEGARRRGAVVRTGTRVTGIDVHDDRVSGVRFDTDEQLPCEVVVNAAGMYANQIGALAGVEVPVVPFAHQFLLTEPVEGVRADMPTLRDPDRLVYFRPEAGGGLVAGGYERTPAPWCWEHGPPEDFNHSLLPEDHERFEPLAEGAVSLVPAMQTAGVVRMINGPEAFTPDGEFVLGETDVPGLFVAAGFCAHGIAGAGGVGKVLAEWIVNGEPELDMWRMDIRRFGSHYRSRNYARERAYEVYATYYDIHYPNEERAAGRPLKTTATYGRLVELGAEFGEKAGWERPNWFRSNEDDRFETIRPRGWAGRHWSTAIAAETLATRERAGLFDESSFAKFEVAGPGACSFLQRVCANDVERPVGAVVYTQLLNRRGGIECDLTVTRLAEDRFRIVTGTAFGNHDLVWIRSHRRTEDDVELRDVTGAFACIGLWGPRSREILGCITAADLSNEAFPFLTAREIVVGDAPCLATRITYVGELGWELYPAAEFARSLWDSLVEAGAGSEMVPAGYRAIDSLRLEKGYRAWGADITPEDTPLEAGLGFAVAFDKDEDFVGREALERQRAEGVTRRLRCLLLSDRRSMCLGNEPVFSGGRVIARVTSGGIGYSIGESIALAYLPTELTGDSLLSVEVFGERVDARVAEEPLYDPEGARTRS
ncbi:MAG TPA: FAD-dependent oxidoreductase, partial [Actinomycetota bacterium]|nr:FAD-dependent oxidoreductase [Actinomycetota bacterium]